MVTTVFCDDAGFTGDNLLNPDQPFFAYSAVAIEPDQATALVQELRDRFGLKGQELKGSALYGRSYSLELIAFLATMLGDRVSIALNHKLYSLCCKLFEYVYEPSIASNSRFFYERGTHFYVAMALFAYLSTGDAAADDVAKRFEAIMRRRAGQPQLYFDASLTAADASDAIDPIIRFAIAQKDQAMQELDGLAGDDGRIRWVLDLSLSSARSVLATVGERLGEIDVVLDESKPLESFIDFLSVFVGFTETVYMELGPRRRPMTFNLHRTPRFGASKSEPGLQIADLFASFAALAARDRHTPEGAAILGVLFPLLDADTIFPDYDAIDLTQKSAVMNMCLVAELTRRAETGEPLLDQMPNYLETMAYLYDHRKPLGFED
mgnify:CR=1 FL=1